MPVPSFLSSFADKAHNAIQTTPLAAHLPASMQHRSSSPDAANQPSANEAAAQGGAKSHTLESLQYQFRSLQQQYTNASPVQKIITTEKGVAIDFDSISRNSKAQSKELYTWGQSEPEDLKDVTDRLAYLNFVQGSLAGSLASKLDSARGPLKALRDAEAHLLPKRNLRANLQTQIARLEHDQVKGGDKKISELRQQLHKAETDDAQLEREVELLKRKAVRESEQLKWDAIREYGEKLVLLSQAASPIIAVLPSVPPTPRLLTLTGHINLPPQLAASDLSRSDTRSFGESHASELSSIHAQVSGSHPPLNSSPLSSHSPTHAQSPPPIDPNALNHAPVQIPSAAPLAPVPVPASTVSLSPGSTPAPAAPLPTVAETGVPVAAGADGPGPASGSLKDIHAASPSAGPRSGGLPSGENTSQPFGVPLPKHETAEEEKRRLGAMYAQQSSATSTSGAPPAFPVPGTDESRKPETAEEEKKRLEREERERILHAGGSSHAPPKDKDEDLPPYQEPSL
ncbi:hypothetical protein D9613_001864 [Agrocybe pediades]|uniref:Uncharacterized protein n=1 Tax=Agrocybe pediades TaxID=84607 RepID=A0A8H4R5Q9_9AGAR|nr:hypothetical protein D9613_001864 [Agrocybe pediades]